MGLSLSCALLSVLVVAVFLQVWSCSGLERADGRFWELLPAVTVHGVTRGVSPKDLSKNIDLCGNKADPPSLVLGEHWRNKATWMAGFLGFRSWRCQVSQEPLLISGLVRRHEIFPVSLRSLSRERKPSWKQGVISPCFCQLGQKCGVL